MRKTGRNLTKKLLLPILGAVVGLTLLATAARIAIESGTPEKVYENIFHLFLFDLFKAFSISAVVYLIVHYTMSRRLAKVIEYVENFDFQNIPAPFRGSPRPFGLGKKDEIDNLAVAVNRMRDNLELSYDVLNQLNRNLESKVNNNTMTIIEQRQKLEHAAKMTALGEMAGGVAHEINTPLATIILNTDILLEATKGEPNIRLIQSSARSIAATVDRIARIVRGLRTFSRDGTRDPMEIVPLHQVCEDTFSLCRERFANKGVELVFMAGTAAWDVECRPIEIGQVLLNLMNNAYDAVRDLPVKWIRVELLERSGGYVIMVTDSGNGIPKDIQAKMGQPFFTTKGVQGGTGLGLSISRGIMQTHNGGLEIDNDSDHTCFVLTLPKRQPAKNSQAA